MFEIQNVKQVGADGEKKYQKSFRGQGETSFNVINKSPVCSQQIVVLACVPVCEAMVSNTCIYCSWINFSH